MTATESSSELMVEKISVHVYMLICVGQLFAYSRVYINVCAHMCEYTAINVLGLNGLVHIHMGVVCGNQGGHVTTGIVTHSGNTEFYISMADIMHFEQYHLN